MGSFYNHILCAFHQLRQWPTTGEALIDVRNPLAYGWKENCGDYILVTTANVFAPSFLVELISCNCKNIAKNLPFVIQMGKIAPTCVDAAKFCENTDPPLTTTVLEEDLHLQEEPC